MRLQACSRDRSRIAWLGMEDSNVRDGEIIASFCHCRDARSRFGGLVGGLGQGGRRRLRVGSVAVFGSRLGPLALDAYGYNEMHTTIAVGRVYYIRCCVIRRMMA